MRPWWHVEVYLAGRWQAMPGRNGFWTRWDARRFARTLHWPARVVRDWPALENGSRLVPRPSNPS
jgi:hypothetical protein